MKITNQDCWLLEFRSYFTVLTVAFMGKSGYNLIEERIFTFFRKHGPPDRVRPTRYRIGLVLFVLPIPKQKRI